MDDGAAVNSRDIFGNPFIPIDRATGQPMRNFNERWRSGMVAMIAAFRALMPSALLDGHAMDVTDANITLFFNAISIGFTAPQMIERLTPFAAGLSLYDAWMTAPARSPKITMVESAVRFQLGYGYGFDRDMQTLISYNCTNSHSAAPGAPMPGIGAACAPSAPQPPGYLLPETFLAARAEYQYMRFGLAFTLMRDGYFTHEAGDSWHGQDWDYDELHFALGAARGPARAATVVNPNPAPVPPAIPLPPQGWSLYVRTPVGSNASWALDPAVRPPVAGAPASARVDIDGTAAAVDGIDLSQVVADFESGGYLLSFWARASRDGTPAQLNARKNGGDWHNLGLSENIVVSTGWAQYNITFAVTADGTPARLSWFLGDAAASSSVWVNSPTLAGVTLPLPVLTRDFDCGTVVLNGDTVNRTVILDAGLRRLTGEQAPLWQYFVDDASSAFQATAGAWAVGDFDNGYDGVNGPSSEEVRPATGYYHHWAKGAHHAAAPAAASFALAAPVAGTYNVSMWWPAAVPARATWSSALRVTITPGTTAVTLDLTTQGGDLFMLIAADVQLGPDSQLAIECPAGAGDCIADAVLVESAARWNDGSDASTVTLQPMDGIILQKATGAPPHCAAA